MSSAERDVPSRPSASRSCVENTEPEGRCAISARRRAIVPRPAVGCFAFAIVRKLQRVSYIVTGRSPRGLVQSFPYLPSWTAPERSREAPGEDRGVKIAEKLGTRRPFFSFEFFPPKSDDAEKNLFRTIESLKPVDPGFVSITYGAGGSTRTRTVDIAKRLRTEAGFDVMAHVTCSGATADELRELLRDLRRGGIENIMALRGDPPKGNETFVAAEGGFRYASDLIALLKAEFSFCVGGACYPETHPEA